MKQESKIEDKLELIENYLKDLDSKIGSELADIKGRLYHFDNFEQNFFAMKDRIDSFEQNFFAMKDRIDSFEQNFFAMKDRITHIESLLSNHVTGTDKKIDALTKKIDLLLKEKNQI